MRVMLIDLRNKKGFTQAVTAEKLGISRSFYGSIELGIRNPTIDLAQKIADLFEADAGAIFFTSTVSKRNNEKEKKSRHKRAS